MSRYLCRMEARKKYLYVLMLGGIVASVCCQTVNSSTTKTPQSQCEWLCSIPFRDGSENPITGELCLDSCNDGYFSYGLFQPEQCNISDPLVHNLLDEVPGQTSSLRTPTTVLVKSTTTPRPLVFCRKCEVSGCSICQDEEDQKCQTCQEEYLLHNTTWQCYLTDQITSEILATEAIVGIVIGIILLTVIGIVVAIVVLRRFRGSGNIPDHVQIEKSQENGRWGRTESKELDQMGLAPPPPVNPYTDMGTANDKSYDPLEVSQPAGPTEDYSPLKEEDYLNPQLEQSTTESESIYVNSKDQNLGPSSVDQSADRGKSGFLQEKGNNPQMPAVRAQGSVDIYEPMDANQGASFDIYMNQECLALVENVPETEEDIYVNDNGGDDVYQNQ